MDSFEKDVLDRLARIEERQKMPSASCAVHTEQINKLDGRLEKVEVQVGKQNVIAVTLGAFGASIVLAIKYLASRGG